MNGSGIDLRCCSIEDIFRESITPDLVIADPPWQHGSYGFGKNRGAMSKYASIELDECVEHIRIAASMLADPGYLIVWQRGVLMPHWFKRHHAIQAKYVSMGAWVKSDKTGIGYHWRGVSEFALLYKKGKPSPRGHVLNGVSAPRRSHSEKPIEWQAELIRAFCPEGGLVLDMYAGLGSVAHACVLANARYLGAEIDPKRYALAREGLGLFAS